MEEETKDFIDFIKDVHLQTGMVLKKLELIKDISSLMDNNSDAKVVHKLMKSLDYLDEDEEKSLRDLTNKYCLWVEN